MLESGWMQLPTFLEWMEVTRPQIIQFFEPSGDDWVPLDADEQFRLPRQQWTRVLAEGGPVRVLWWPTLKEVHVRLG